jgi:hypothetical protein
MASVPHTQPAPAAPSQNTFNVPYFLGYPRPMNHEELSDAKIDGFIDYSESR